MRRDIGIGMQNGDVWILISGLQSRSLHAGFNAWTLWSIFPANGWNGIP